MKQQTLEQFISALGAKQATPGGGAAAALTGAQGAALVEMVARFSQGKPGSGNATIAWEEIAKTMAGHASTFLDLAVRNQEAFAQVMQCYDIDKDDPDRSTKMEAALLGAAEPPLQTIELAWEIVKTLEPLIQKANAHVVSDAGIAVALLQAAISSSIYNVLINAKFMKDDTRREATMNRLASIREPYQAECDKLRQLAEQRI